MKIALASVPVRDRDISYNRNMILQTISTCRGKADLVIFGESVLQGFNCMDWRYSSDKNMAASRRGEEISEIAQAAKCNAIAVSFGYIEKTGDTLYSSQIVINDHGEVIHNFRRVSVGWKKYWLTDSHYREGTCFEPFVYKDKCFAIGLCGDLWADGKPEEMRSLGADVILWPVYCDFTAEEWNKVVKFEYARQAALCGGTVLYVNSVCINPEAEDRSTGGAALMQEGRITAEVPAGVPGLLIVDV